MSTTRSTTTSAIDRDSVTWRRVLDVSDRALRNDRRLGTREDGVIRATGSTSRPRPR
jgi:formyltetrahydrofolate synthetase